MSFKNVRSGTFIFEHDDLVTEVFEFKNNSINVAQKENRGCWW